MFADSLLGIVLFGSAARGESREDSDIDLLVVLGRERSLSRSLYSLWDERFGAIKESPHFVHIPVNPGCRLDLARSRSRRYRLFDRNGVVLRFLGSIRRLIASGDRKRRWAYGHPYWVKEKEGTKMFNDALASDYLKRAGHRLKALQSHG